MSDKSGIRTIAGSSVPAQDSGVPGLHADGTPKDPVNRLAYFLDQRGEFPVHLHELDRLRLDESLVKALSVVIAAWRIEERRNEVREVLRGIVVLDEGPGTKHPNYSADTHAVERIKRILTAANVRGITVRSGVERRSQQTPPPELGTRDMDKLFDVSQGNIDFDITALIDQIAALPDSETRMSTIAKLLTSAITQIAEQWAKLANKNTLHLSTTSVALPTVVIKNICNTIADQLKRKLGTQNTKITSLEEQPQYGTGVTPRRIAITPRLL